MKKVIAVFILFVLVVSYSMISYAHPGRTDASGGHYNRKTGGYHYHNSDRPLPIRESRFLHNAPGTLVKPPDNKKPVRKQLDRKKSFRQRLEEVEQRLNVLTERLDNIEKKMHSNYKLQQQKQPDAAKSSSVEVGEQGYLEGIYLFGPENKKCVPVAISKTALDAWIDTHIANDIQGASELLLSGRVFVVDDKTPVLRLSQSGLFIRKVRILKGEHQGDIGWVEAEYLKK